MIGMIKPCSTGWKSKSLVPEKHPYPFGITPHIVPKPGTDSDKSERGLLWDLRTRSKTYGRTQSKLSLTSTLSLSLWNTWEIVEADSGESSPAGTQGFTFDVKSLKAVSLAGD